MSFDARSFFFLFFFTFAFFTAGFTSADSGKGVVVFSGVHLEVEHEDNVDDENNPSEIWEETNESCDPPDFSQVPDVVNVQLHGWIEGFSHPVLTEVF